MVAKFNGIQFCRDIAQPNKSGGFQVDSNGVTWNVFVSKGNLQYAAHSLQTFETLTYHLTHLGYDVPQDALNRLSSNFRATLDSNSRGLSLYELVDQLALQGLLDNAAIQALKLALSKDALEPLIWLKNARYIWLERDFGHASLSPLNQVISQLEDRLKSWQKFLPVITSPYQEPVCPDLTVLDQTISGGMLNPSLLGMVARLMQGKSIRQLSLFLKQDDLKVAHLLYPYIQAGVFVLEGPNSPYCKLPNVPKKGAQASSPGESIVSTAVPKTPKKVYKIVCIDDSPVILETIQDYLGAEGFEVATVENPMESMSTLFSMKPDLILMDVSMPGINGNRLCEILRRSAAFKELPIVMVSGNISVLDRAKAESSGATDYLTKPFSKAELLNIVENHLSVKVSG